MAQSSIFDVSDETRKKAGDFFSADNLGSTIGGALSAAGTAAGGIAAGRPIAPGYGQEQTPLAAPKQPPAPPASETQGEVPREKRLTDIAGEYRPPSAEEAYAQAEAMYGKPVLASGGGYKAEQAGVSGLFREAMGEGERAGQGVLEAQKQYREKSEPLRQAEQLRLQKAAEDEKLRMGRLQKLGVQQEDLSKEMAGRVEGFKVDPDRLFGQGGQRAMTNFSLGIANILSNVGEAMQGKAGTNAILSFVRDRIAQDIALQENDFQRMLQGYNVRRNGLMDAIQQVGNERAGAEALGRQQALVYANQLDMLAEKVKDAQLANTIHQASATMKMNVAAHEQSAKQFDVAQTNQARQTAATTSAHASAVNAQILNSRNTAAAAYASALRQVDPTSQSTIQGILKVARDKNLGTQYDLLSQIKTSLQDPKNAEAMVSVAKDLVKQLHGSKDPDAVQAAVARLVSSSSLTPSQRSALDLFREFGATKMVGRGGKSLTLTEALLYDPFINASEKTDINRIVDQQMEFLQSEKQQLFKEGGFGVQSPAGAALANALNFFVPSDVATRQPPAPKPSEIAK